MKTKTYAIVSSMYPPHVGGVERYSYNLAKKLASNGNRVIVITSGEDKLKRGWNQKVLSAILFILRWQITCNQIRKKDLKSLQ